MNNMQRSCLAFCAIAVIAVIGAAQSQKRNAVKEGAILDQLRRIAPASVRDFEAGTEALDSDDYATAAAEYQKVVDKAPGFDPALRRLGLSLAGEGHVREGRQLLDKAVAINRSPENLISVAEVMAYPGHNVASSKEDKEQAMVLVREANSKVTDDDPSYKTFMAQLALDLDRLDEFRAAATALAKHNPDLLQTHYFNAILAAMDEKWTRAEDEIREAGRLGLPPAAVQAFLDSGIHSRASTWRYAYYSLYMTGIWALGLVLLFILGWVLSSLTLRSIETDDPSNPDIHRHKLLRTIYRRLIGVAGIYYYVSVPFVIFLVLGVAGSVTYGFIQWGHIPIKLLVIIVAGALVTSYKMVHTLFIRREKQDPGRPLKTQEAPGLWRLAREVASRVGTRPVDEIRITPGTDLAVYERGSFTERQHDRGHRILILGIASLNGFSQNAFRAVLAHEYGHLTHRDTAGGDVALRVNSNMQEFAIAMIHAGQAVWWNIAFQFLRIYHFIFMRLSHGATRLQEVLADRIAVLNYGAKPFEEGLRHVIRRSIEFEDIAYWEFSDAKRTRRPLQNLYELDSKNLRSIEEKFREAIARPTTQDNTHPGPQDRFRYAARIVSHPAAPIEGMVWDLFSDREALTSEMSASINRSLRAGAVSR
jgi:tetratricopeptide (TPR) repeat protein